MSEKQVQAMMRAIQILHNNGITVEAFRDWYHEELCSCNAPEPDDEEPDYCMICEKDIKPNSTNNA